MRVLVARLSALGDIVHTWPLVEALRRDDRVERIAWVVEEPLADLVRGHPAVDLTITVATRRWRRRITSRSTWAAIAAARRAVRAFGADVAIDAQGLVKSALWAAASRSSRRIGLAPEARREWIAGAFYTTAVRPPSTARHVIDINLSLLADLDIAPPFGAVPDGRFLVTSAGRPAPPAGCVAIVPAAGRAGKIAGPGLLGEVARRCRKQGHVVAIVWGPGERERAQAVVDAADGAAQLAPETSIVELASFFAPCSAVVGADTGPIHLAASLGVPTVALHLSTDPARNGPRGACVRVVDATAGTAARGRARTRAAREVTAEEVVAAINAALAERAAGPDPGVLCNTRPDDHRC